MHPLHDLTPACSKSSSMEGAAHRCSACQFGAIIPADMCMHAQCPRLSHMAVKPASRLHAHMIAVSQVGLDAPSEHIASQGIAMPVYVYRNSFILSLRVWMSDIHLTREDSTFGLSSQKKKLRYVAYNVQAKYGTSNRAASGST